MAGMLSRTSTIVASMQRLNLMSSNYNGEQQFRMHIIGSDEMELVCFISSTSKPLPETYRNVFKDVALRGFSSLEILFIGPNMPSTVVNKETTITYRDDANVEVQLDVTLKFKGDFYHDFWNNEVQLHPRATMTPHLVVLFNPGLWGYDSWLPTLRLFFTEEAFVTPEINGDKQPPVYFVITSYTLEESEVDYDAVFEFYTQLKENPVDTTSAYNLTWMWDCEVNDYRCVEPCSVVRKTCGPNTVYYDNYAWQCIYMAVKLD